MIVYFLRHANAGQRRQSPVQDERRPLDKEGIEQCRWVGRLLSSLDVHVDLIFSSPLKRATQTASMVGNEIAYEQRIERTPALGPAANFESFRLLLNQVRELEAVMVATVSAAARLRRRRRENYGCMVFETIYTLGGGIGLASS